MSKSPLAPERFPDMPQIDGIRIGTAEAGIKYANRTDLLLVRLPEDCAVAGVFTQSKTCSGAIDWCRNVLAGDKAPRAILVNSGNANAFTGASGQSAVEVSAKLAAEKMGCVPEEILLASTGVIGEVLPTDPIRDALRNMECGDGFEKAAEAIMTTDTFPKGSVVKIGDATICGIAKGSGMIAPDMATMLAFVFTDAKVSKSELQAMLHRTCDTTFNAITVDSDTSTSDTLIVAATGQVDVDSSDFEKALGDVLRDLAHQIVRDGEGATKFIEVQVSGAADDSDAKRVALSIANSPLVKTAIAGEDANWGRIVMAVGKSGAEASRDTLAISIGGITIAEKGEAVTGYDEAPVAKHMQGDDILVEADLGLGKGSATVWTCDLTHGYISINADYRS